MQLNRLRDLDFTSRFSFVGRRNQGRPSKRLLEVWDRNESTTIHNPCYLDDVDDDDDDDDDNDDDDIFIELQRDCFGVKNYSKSYIEKSRLISITG